MPDFTAHAPARSTHGPLMTTYRPPRIRRMDWINPAVLCTLSTLGVFFIKSAERATTNGTQWHAQLLWLGMGAVLYVAVSSFDYHVWMKNAWLVYLGGIIMLLLLWSPLGEVRGGARRWLHISSYTIQPSEFAKIGTLVMLSFALAKSELGTIRDSLSMLGKVALIVAVPMMLIFLQPDLGSSLALFPTVFALLYVSNLSVRFFATVFGLFLAALWVLKVDIKHYENFVQTRQVLQGKTSLDEYDNFLQSNHPGVVSSQTAQTREFLLGKINLDDYNKYLQKTGQEPITNQGEIDQEAFWQNYFAALAPLYIPGLGGEEKKVLQGKVVPVVEGNTARNKVLAGGMTLSKYEEFLQNNHLTVVDRLGSYQAHSWLPLKDYQRDRIASFLDPEDVDRQGIGVTWNQKQSQIAVGTGGLTGKGYENGTQARLGYLPSKVATSDFIMSVFLEETGFIGGLAVIGLYAILLGNTLRIAWMARDRFGRLLCVGVAVLFMVHVFVNIGMVQGLMPVKGIPLPLMSYGGSFVLGCCILMGLVQSVHRYSRESV